MGNNVCSKPLLLETIGYFFKSHAGYILEYVELVCFEAIN